MRIPRPLAIGTLVAVIAIGGIGGWTAAPYVTATAHLLDIAGYEGVLRRVLPIRRRELRVDDIAVPTRHGELAARRYQPVDGASRHVIVFPGIQAGGVDEPRLDAFARRLAELGVTVLSVPLPDLRMFRVTPRSTDMVEDATRWMADQPALSREGRVGLMGISFSGGLALVAAGRPSLAGRLTMVLTLGSHGDLPRVMTYLCGADTSGRNPPPHDYGAAVIALGTAEAVVPADQVEPYSEVVFTFLQSSSLAGVDPETSTRLFDRATELTESLPMPARRLAQWVTTRDVDSLGPVLLPHVEAFGGAPALSPARSAPPTAPVFLIHGPDDTVIPASELDLMAEDLRRRGTGPVRTLVTPVLRHANLQGGISLSDAWRLVAFWTAVQASWQVPASTP